ncbi:MAG: hypothetical protein J5631_06280 [Spirochaetaceae bacterium]|nr:hypothetical protein [Spirochaetaceae bacterium]
MNNDTMIVALFTFFGAFVGSALASVIGLITSYLDRKARREEMEKNAFTNKQKNKARSLCDQIATYYRLEQLYIDEIKNLRAKGETTGIMNEFRNKVYTASESNVRIELNDSSVLAEKEYLFAE